MCLCVCVKTYANFVDLFKAKSVNRKNGKSRKTSRKAEN